MASSAKKCNIKEYTLKELCLKLIFLLKAKFLRNSKKYSLSQYIWKHWSPFIPENDKYYDVAISYMNGFCNYYVIDKIKAHKKVLYMHNDYNKIDSIASFDLPYFKKANILITISDICANSLKENFPSIANKILVIENISSVQIITKMRKMYENNDYFKDTKFKILSIGRLTEQKGFDIAIETALILKRNNLNFTWYIIGEGELHNTLEKLIKKHNLNNNFKLLGVKSNPYCYMDKADIFVMTSRYEGKSIALDEAKIIGLPIVITNFPSVYDSIKHLKNGIITNMNPENIANAIISLYNSTDLRHQLTLNLQKEIISNENTVINQYLSILS